MPALEFFSITNALAISVSSLLVMACRSSDAIEEWGDEDITTCDRYLHDDSHRPYVTHAFVGTCRQPIRIDLGGEKQR